MTREEMKQKVYLMHRANWLNKCIGKNVDLVTSVYANKPKSETEKQIRELEIARDTYLMNYDLLEAMEEQNKINELMGE